MKRAWWNINDSDGQEEFIKNVTAMANTPGNDGYFKIGVDEKDGKLFDASFPSGGKYDDPSKFG